MSEKNGTDFVFISYAHKDAQNVLPVLRKLEERGVRFWFDAGIEAGADWPKTVAGRLRSSGAVIVFASGNFARSQNCTRELNFAVSERKQIIKVKTDGKTLTDDINMQLSGVPEIVYESAGSTAERIEKALPDSFKGEALAYAEDYRKIPKKRFNVWALVAVLLVLLIAAAVVFAGAALRGWFGTKPVITHETAEIPDAGTVSVTGFNSDLALEAAMRSLNTQYVFLCGDSLVSDAAAITHGDGGFCVAGEPVKRGRFSDLSWLNGQNITQLALVYVSLTDLTGIDDLKDITYLDISGNQIENLEALAKLPELETLKILGLPDNADLSPLTRAPKLSKVIISYGMRDCAEPLAAAGIEVVIKK